MKKYIWGIGRLTGKIVGRYISLDEIEGFIDNNEQVKEFLGKKVIQPKDVVNCEYDAIIVINSYSQEIYQQSKEIGIDINKMVFVYANCIMNDLNKNYEFVSEVLGEELANIVKNRYHIVRDLDINKKLMFENLDCKKFEYKKTDWVRIKEFELVIEEIKKMNLKGAVAEVGVFKGEFAQFINYAFPNDIIYLFDTFEGFDTNEALEEMKSGHCTSSFIEAYKNTSVLTVLDKMKYVDNVKIMKGYFPDSLNGLEEQFKFVSIDCDFEESIYECLKYFYPRLVIGGYIFIHDYNSALLGVEKAVLRYEEEFGHICKVPLCDANGTIVITK